MTYPILALALIVIALIIDMLVLKTWVVRKKSTWLVLGILCALTIIFDSLLVELPVVTYSHSAISGIRLLGIPLEDFSYTFVAVIVPLSIRTYLI